MPKPTNIAELNTALMTSERVATGVHWRGNWIILQRTLIVFVCCCSGQTSWALRLNTEWAADIHHWNVWTVSRKAVQSLTHYSWIFNAQLHGHWKIERQGLICCICWTTAVVSIKFTRYGVWIITYSLKVWLRSIKNLPLLKPINFSMGTVLQWCTLHTSTALQPSQAFN